MKVAFIFWNVLSLSKLWSRNNYCGARFRSTLRVARAKLVATVLNSNGRVWPLGRIVRRSLQVLSLAVHNISHRLDDVVWNWLLKLAPYFALSPGLSKWKVIRWRQQTWVDFESQSDSIPPNFIRNFIIEFIRFGCWKQISQIPKSIKLQVVVLLDVSISRKVSSKPRDHEADGFWFKSPAG